MIIKTVNILSAMMILTFALSCSENKEQTETKKSETPVIEQKAPDSEVRPLATVAASDRLNYYQSEPAMMIDQDKKYTATIQTEKGNIVVELNPFYAPMHTNSFVFLARQGFFDGLTFHRVEPNFVIQGGDPLGSGTGGPGYTIPAEFGLIHNQGVIAMARQADQVNPEKRSNGSQFYITLQETFYLDKLGYSVFGKVVEGFDIVQQIAIGDVILRVDVLEE